MALRSELERLPIIGPGGVATINTKPDLERILSVRLALLLAAYMEPSVASTVQGALGIPVVVLDAGAGGFSEQAFFASLDLVAEIIGRGKRAGEIARFMSRVRADLDHRTRDLPSSARPKSYVGGIGYRGSRGILSTDSDYLLFLWTHTPHAAGKKVPHLGSHLFLDLENLLALDPDVIFVNAGALPLISDDALKHPALYGALQAFRKRRVFRVFPHNYYMTNVETALVDAYTVGKVLYPQRFLDVRVDEKADEIFSFFVGRPVYREMVKAYGGLGTAWRPVACHEEE